MNSQCPLAECTGIKILQCVHGGFMVNQVAGTLEAFFTETTLIVGAQLMDVSNVFL
jgi:hypothetical protein